MTSAGVRLLVSPNYFGVRGFDSVSMCMTMSGPYFWRMNVPSRKGLGGTFLMPGGHDALRDVTSSCAWGSRNQRNHGIAKNQRNRGNIRVIAERQRNHGFRVSEQVLIFHNKVYRRQVLISNNKVYCTSSGFALAMSLASSSTSLVIRWSSSITSLIISWGRLRGGLALVRVPPLSLPSMSFPSFAAVYRSVAAVVADRRAVPSCRRDRCFQ